MYLPHVTCSFFPRGHSVVIIGAEKNEGVFVRWITCFFVAYVEKYKKKTGEISSGKRSQNNYLTIYYVSLLRTINNPKKSSLSFHLIFNIIITTNVIQLIKLFPEWFKWEITYKLLIVKNI